jgi:hypothetical protein
LHTMTTTTENYPDDRRAARIWAIKDILSRVGPSDMTDAELEAALAIFQLADSRLPHNRPILRIIPKKWEEQEGTGSS